MPDIRFRVKIRWHATEGNVSRYYLRLSRISVFETRSNDKPCREPSLRLFPFFLPSLPILNFPVLSRGHRAYVRFRVKQFDASTERQAIALEFSGARKRMPVACGWQCSGSCWCACRSWNCVVVDGNECEGNDTKKNRKLEELWGDASRKDLS